MKTVHLESISQECKYANHYSTHGTNTNVEEECMHVASLRGRSDDGGGVCGEEESKKGGGRKSGVRRRARDCTATHCLTFSNSALNLSDTPIKPLFLKKKHSFFFFSLPASYLLTEEDEPGEDVAQCVAVKEHV